MRRPTSLGVICLAAVAGCTSTPPYEGMTAEEAFAYSQRRFEEGEYGDAIEALERLTASGLTFDRMAEARLLLADAFFRDGQHLTAVSEYTRVLDRYAGSEVADDAALGVCRSYVELSPIPQRDQTYTEQALQACRNTASDYASSDIGDQARQLADLMFERLAEKDFEVAESYFRLGFYDSARIYYEDVVEKYPETPAAPRSLLRLVELFTRIEYDDLAEESRQRLLNDYPDSPSAQLVRERGQGRVTGA